MQKIYFVFLLCCSFTVGIAQLKIEVGTPYKEIDAFRKFPFIKDDKVLIVKVEGRTVFIVKFNPALNTESSKTYTDIPKEAIVETVLEIKNKYYVFYAVRIGEVEQLFAREINFDTGELANDGLKILEIKGKLSGRLEMHAYQSMVVREKYSFYYALDLSKLLIKYTLAPHEKVTDLRYETIGLNVFDENLTQQWKHEFQMPFIEMKLTNINFTVDSKGNVYIISQVYKDKTSRQKNVYSYEVLKVSALTKEVVHYPINLPGKYVRELRLKENQRNEIVCAGLYGKDAETPPAGLFLLRFAEEGNVDNVKTYGFTLDIASLNADAATKREKRDEGFVGIDRLIVSNVLLQDDGSTLFINEQSFIDNYQHSYNCNDILITKINIDGSLAWMKKIPKQQSTFSFPNAISYKYFKSNESHHFLYMDNEKNSNLTADDVPTMYHEKNTGTLRLTKIDDKSGAVTTSSVVDTGNVIGYEISKFITREFLPLKEGGVVFEVNTKKKENCLVRLKAL